MNVHTNAIGRRALISFVAMFMAISVGFSQNPDKGNLVVNAFVENINDSTQVQVKLKYDESGVPQYYFCHLNTPVCEHGLCKLMVIDVYWDVLGNFLKYETPPDEPLTKFDHLPFTEEDHVQLRKILSNSASILRDYPVDDLVDHRLVKKSEVVDAVSAATRLAVKDAIVSGAVYSTYTLWHIVNGPIASRIEQYTRPLFSEKLLMNMFYSDNVHYQYFALNYYPPQDSMKYLPEVIHLVKNGVEYIPYFAIEKVPTSAWTTEKYQVALMEHFPHGDFELQNAFLNKIADIDLSAKAIDLLVSGSKKITDKQLVKVLEIVNRNKERLESVDNGAIDN